MSAVRPTGASLVCGHHLLKSWAYVTHSRDCCQRWSLAQGMAWWCWVLEAALWQVVVDRVKLGAEMERKKEPCSYTGVCLAGSQQRDTGGG